MKIGDQVEGAAVGGRGVVLDLLHDEDDPRMLLAKVRIDWTNRLGDTQTHQGWVLACDLRALDAVTQLGELAGRTSP